MEIIVDRLAKRFRNHWVFRNMSLSIPAGQSVGITGPNGSGKSTLLKVLSGALPASQGQIQYRKEQREIESADIYRHIMFAAPYVDLIDEMTIAEAVTFHGRFRTFRNGLSIAGFVDLLGTTFHNSLIINELSSGMKQRMRLALALCTETDILMLDEPTTNLDAEGIGWFHEMLQMWGTDCTTLVASNVDQDMSGCSRYIHLPDFSSGQ